MAILQLSSELSLQSCMKHLIQLVCAMVAACVVASCNNADPFYGTGPASTTTATTLDLGPPVFGSPAYVSSQIGNGPPYARSGFYPYSASRPGGMGYYDRVASPRGSFDYIYHDLEQPHPSPGTPLKKKTWRYTSRYPSSWGAPVWVSTYTPLRSARQGNATTAQ